MEVASEKSENPGEVSIPLGSEMTQSCEKGSTTMVSVFFCERTLELMQDRLAAIRKANVTLVHIDVDPMKVASAVDQALDMIEDLLTHQEPTQDGQEEQGAQA